MMVRVRRWPQARVERARRPRTSGLRIGGLAPLAALALSACGTAVIPPPSRGFAPATRSAPSAGVIGANARALIHLFGDPRLDIRDPAVRKLQFANGRCVLDAYLYPPRERREPVVTYAEARAIDGSAMDLALCVDQLRRR